MSGLSSTADLVAETAARSNFMPLSSRSSFFCIDKLLANSSEQKPACVADAVQCESQHELRVLPAMTEDARDAQARTWSGSR